MGGREGTHRGKTRPSKRHSIPVAYTPPSPPSPGLPIFALVVTCIYVVPHRSHIVPGFAHISHPTTSQVHLSCM